MPLCDFGFADKSDVRALSDELRHFVNVVDFDGRESPDAALAQELLPLAWCPVAELTFLHGFDLPDPGAGSG